MTCRTLHPEIALLAGGELPPARRREIEHHLATCADCRALAAALQGDRRLLQGLADEPVAADALDRIRGRVRAAIAEEQGEQAQRTASRRRGRRALLGLAAVLAALSLGLVLWLAGLRPGTEPTRLADRNPPPAAGPGSSQPGAPTGPRAAAPDQLPDQPEGAKPFPPATHGQGINRPGTPSRPATAPGAPATGGTRPSAAPGAAEAPDLLAAGSLASAVAPPEELDPDAVLSAQAALDALGPHQEPSITIQVVSDDPDIVFYWLVDEPKEVSNDEAV